MTATPDSPLPPETHGTTVVAIVACYAGALDEGEAVLRPLRTFARPLVDLIQPMPYAALQSMIDGGYPRGRFNYWKSSYVDELSDGLIDTVLEHGTSMTSPYAGFYFEHLGGAIARPREDTAFGNRDAQFDFAILTSWEPDEEPEQHCERTQRFWTAMQPFAAHGVYVNNLGAEGQERVRRAYDAASYDRMVALKQRCDPDNVFRINQNVRPARQPAASR